MTVAIHVVVVVEVTTTTAVRRHTAAMTMGIVGVTHAANTTATETTEDTREVLIVKVATTIADTKTLHSTAWSSQVKTAMEFCTVPMGRLFSGLDSLFATMYAYLLMCSV